MEKKTSVPMVCSGHAPEHEPGCPTVDAPGDLWEVQVVRGNDSEPRVQVRADSSLHAAAIVAARYDLPAPNESVRDDEPDWGWREFRCYDDSAIVSYVSVRRATGQPRTPEPAIGPEPRILGYLDPVRGGQRFEFALAPRQSGSEGRIGAVVRVVGGDPSWDDWPGAVGRTEARALERFVARERRDDGVRWTDPVAQRLAGALALCDARAAARERHAAEARERIHVEECKVRDLALAKAKGFRKVKFRPNLANGSEQLWEGFERGGLIVHKYQGPYATGYCITHAASGLNLGFSDELTQLSTAKAVVVRLLETGIDWTRPGDELLKERRGAAVIRALKSNLWGPLP